MMLAFKIAVAVLVVDLSWRIVGPSVKAAYQNFRFRHFRSGGLVSNVGLMRGNNIPAQLLDGELQLMPAEDIYPGDWVYIRPSDGKVYKAVPGTPRVFRVPLTATIEGGLLSIPQRDWPL